MIEKYLSLVKFSHTIFALPFALIGFAIGTRAVGFDWLILIQVVACMILARSAAMGFNRLIDSRFDAKNPRTANREIPAGKISPRAAWYFIVLCCIGFVVVTATINELTFYLSPLALAIVLGYSLTKRYTSLCHLILGLGLSIAPMAAYIAVTGYFSVPMAIFTVLVWSWVAGFDIIYALQDAEFDASQGLHSIPQALGVRKALIVSVLLHVVSLLSVFSAYFMFDIFEPITYWIGAFLFTGLLVYQHLIVKTSDLSRIDIAFGTTNGVASVIYATFVILSVVLG